MHEKKLRNAEKPQQTNIKYLLVVIFLSLLAHFFSLITFFNVEYTPQHSPFNAVIQNPKNVIFFADDKSLALRSIQKPQAKTLVVQPPKELLKELKKENLSELPASLKAGKFTPKTADAIPEEKIVTNPQPHLNQSQQKCIDNVVVQEEAIHHDVKKEENEPVFEHKETHLPIKQTMFETVRSSGSKKIEQKLQIAKKIPTQDTKHSLDLSYVHKEITKSKIKVEIPKKKNILAMTSKFIDQITGKRNTSSIDKGVMNFFLNENGYGFERRGDDSKLPSPEELIVIAYDEGVCRGWQNSLMLNFAYLIEKPGKTTLKFTINQQGNLATIEVLESSGDQKFDQIIVHSLKFAAPFAPLPSKFKDKLHSNIITFHVR